MNKYDFFIDAAQSFSRQTKIAAKDLIACVDLTALNDTDDECTIRTLCALALEHSVAAVCVSQAFVPLAQSLLRQRPGCQLATVANFPSGTTALKEVMHEIERSLAMGATEIDVVVPYQAFLSDANGRAITLFVKGCKSVVGPSVKLKTILESGLITDPLLLENLALSALEGGADFLKTSTGKVLAGASLESAAVMLGALKSFGDVARGFKASGGVKTYLHAKTYWILARLMMGEHWPAPSCFRLGASSLLSELVTQQQSA